MCFISALVMGLIAHLYKITNWLPNWDSLVFRYDAQNMLSMGRWFLPVVCSFSSFYDLSFLNGVIAIVFHALSAVWFCRILHVEKKLTANRAGNDREYLGGAQDIHEADIEFQKRVRDIYREQCLKDPKFIRIDCSDENGCMLPPDTIFEKIREVVDQAVKRLYPSL